MSGRPATGTAPLPDPSPASRESNDPARLDAPASGWSLELADDLDLPGWIPLPREVAADLREPWATEVASVIQDWAHEEEPGTPLRGDDLRALLGAGLDARDESSSAVLYLVFPTPTATAVLCSVDLVHTVDLPPLPRESGILHSAHAPHIGPGLQYSTRRRVEDGDVRVDVSSVHFVFTDADHGVVISLHEAPALVAAPALPAFVALKDALRVTRPDGSTLSSVAPPGLDEGLDWEPAKQVQL